MESSPYVERPNISLVLAITYYIYMDEIIADKICSMALMFQLTLEGHGKMNMHITACITTCANGQYEDQENQIQGACGPLLIFTHSTKRTKEKKKRERTR
jgi:hypothetical protein